jgi:hypothetical protein
VLNPCFISGSFSLIRAAVSNILTQKDDGSPAALVSLVRAHSRSAQDISRLPAHCDGALRIISKLELRWAQLDALSITRLPPNDLKECEGLILSSALLKSDLLSAVGRPEEAIDTLLKLEQHVRLLDGLPNALLALGIKAFKFGQHVLVQREAAAAATSGKGVLAATCFTTAIKFLDAFQSRQHPAHGSHLRASQDSQNLKSKALTQLALAFHLDGLHDDALRCLDAVPSESSLILVSQELRFSILLSVP